MDTPILNQDFGPFRCPPLRLRLLQYGPSSAVLRLDIAAPQKPHCALGGICLELSKTVIWKS